MSVTPYTHLNLQDENVLLQILIDKLCCISDSGGCENCPPSPEGHDGEVLGSDGAGFVWSAGGDVFTDSTLTGDGTSGDPLSVVGVASEETGLLTGGIVTWLHDYVYNVSPATYTINGVFYTSPSTDITLDPSDPTDDRIDIFVLTTSSTAIDITGTPSTPPVEPPFDGSTQLQVSFALVSANTTEPIGIVNTFIYQENTEWTTSVSAGTINPASTNNPDIGSKDVEGTAVANGTWIKFTSVAAPNVGNYSDLLFRIRSKANWAGNKRWILRWYNGAVAVGNPVNFGSGSYGFLSTNTTTYQSITIPLADFGNISTATVLRITQNNTSGTIGWYLDQIQLQGFGVVSTPLIIAKTVAQMQALAASSGLIPGQLYQITDAYSDSSVLNIRAYSTTELEDSGSGTFENAAMSDPVTCSIWYDLTSDTIRRIYEPLRANDVSVSYEDTDPTQAINAFPFDNNNCAGNVIIDTYITDFVVGNFLNNSFNTVTLTIAHSSTMVNNIINNCGVDIGSVSACQLSGCKIDFTTILTDDHYLTNCTISPSVNFIYFNLENMTSGYAATGKVFGGDTSTFEITPADSADVNPDASRVIDAADFNWAGVWRPNSAANNLKFINNAAEGMRYIIAPSVDNFNILDRDVTAGGGGNGNVWLETSGVTITLDGSTNRDFIELTGAPQPYKIGGYIRS